MIPYAMNRLGIALPYRKLEYLESSGTQYADTGYLFKNSRNSKLEIEFYTSVVSGTMCMFGVRSSVTNQVQNSIYHAAEDKIISADANGFWQYQVGVSRQRKTVIYSANGSGIWIQDGISRTFTGKSPECTFNFCLFAMNDRQISYFCGYGRIYRCSFYENDEPVHQFIPVLWKSGVPYTDGNSGQTATPAADKPGMYDLVTKKLFVNQGTGEFLYA